MDYENLSTNNIPKESKLDFVYNHLLSDSVASKEIQGGKHQPEEGKPKGIVIDDREYGDENSTKASGLNSKLNANEEAKKSDTESSKSEEFMFWAANHLELPSEKTSELRKLIVKLSEPFTSTNYIGLETLGQGSYGKVKKYYDKNAEIFIAIKFLYLKNGENNKGLMKSYLSEIIIQKRLENSNKFLDLYGSYYSENDNGIDTLITVHELGDVNLDELISIRRKRNYRPYEPSEALKFLKFMVEPLIELKSFGIYQSDIKPSNIVYSVKRKKFLIVDFGASKILKNKKKKKHKLTKYANEGTRRYLSPEKRNYFKNKTSERKDINQKDNYFDPFRCDLYSLALCVEEMFLDFYPGEKAKEDPKLLIKVVDMMKKAEWQSRSDVMEIKETLKDYKPEDENIFDENLYKRQIERGRLVIRRNTLDNLFQNYTEIAKSKKVLLDNYSSIINYFDKRMNEPPESRSVVDNDSLYNCLDLFSYIKKELDEFAENRDNLFMKLLLLNKDDTLLRTNINVPPMNINIIQLSFS